MMEGSFYLYSNVTTAETAMLSTAGYVQTISTILNSQTEEKEQVIRLTFIATYAIIFITGAIGNILTFIVMQRGSLRHSSTCFYMAMLAVSDSCKS